MVLKLNKRNIMDNITELIEKLPDNSLSRKLVTVTKDNENTEWNEKMREVINSNLKSIIVELIEKEEQENDNQ